MIYVYLENLDKSCENLLDLYQSNPDAYEAYCGSKFFRDIDVLRDKIQKLIVDLEN